MSGLMGKTWVDLWAILPNLACMVAVLAGISFALRPLTFGPLLIEVRVRRHNPSQPRIRRSYPLSDLISLLLLLQGGIGAAVAIGRRPGFHFLNLSWNPPLDAIDTTAVALVLSGTILWWWWDSNFLLNAVELTSGLGRFLFLTLWTPLGYLSHWLLFFGGCGVLAITASKGSAISRSDTHLRIEPEFYLGIFAFGMLAAGLFGVILARWACSRLADDAFERRITAIRARHHASDGV